MYYLVSGASTFYASSRSMLPPWGYSDIFKIYYEKFYPNKLNHQSRNSVPISL